jgi:NDP-hexose 4-ketoreductase
MLIRLVRAGRVLVHDGARRNLIDVEDVVAIVDHLLARDVCGDVVNVASGFSVPVETVVDHLEGRLGVAASRDHQGGGSTHAVSVERLHALVPETAGFGFGPDYFRAAVDRTLEDQAARATSS